VERLISQGWVKRKDGSKELHVGGGIEERERKLCLLALTPQLPPQAPSATFFLASSFLALPAAIRPFQPESVCRIFIEMRKDLIGVNCASDTLFR